MLLSGFTLKKRNQDVSIDLAINLIKLEFQTQSLKYWAKYTISVEYPI